MPTSERIREEVRRAYEELGINQTELGRRVGHDQTWVSKIVNGASKVDQDDLLRIEGALGLPRGLLLTKAGYVMRVRSVPDAIAADPLLPPELKRSLTIQYLALVEAFHEGKAGGGITDDLGPE